MLSLRVPLLVAVVLLPHICNVGGAPGPDFLRDFIDDAKNRIQGKSDFQAAAEKVRDVFTDRRDIEFKGSLLNGDLEISTTMTTEEKIMYSGIVVGVVVALIGCCAMCCKKQRRRNVIVYKEATPPVAVQPYQPQTAPAHSVALPMAGQGLYPNIHGSKVPPPPYPGMS